ncbi:MAG: hypothetical protein M3340_11990 [Actinomycetota bacterium]|nr:hypothetical protein [Actinomycetota bacterium]
MDPRRLRIGEWIAGIGGAALLAVMFLEWFSGRTAWEAFSIADLLLALAGAMGVGVAVMAAAHNTPAVSLALASLLALVGFVAAIVVAVKAIAPPDDLARSGGLWLGLAGCLLTTAGAFATMRDERFPRGARVDVPIETLPPPEGGKA